MPTIHLLIKGKVQGVFYRASAKKMAESLGITGWIRNTREGDVEAVATGDHAQISEFSDWCKEGPEHAEVNAVTTTYEAETPFTDFRIRH